MIFVDLFWQFGWMNGVFEVLTVLGLEFYFPCRRDKKRRRLHIPRTVGRFLYSD